ncbi:hypothetical protein KHA80_08255 [Anaerobacillus sp. HL2]|nr:hypothetical protein KHA80_08255 [Anaerobacillus sp. HL2]
MQVEVNHAKFYEKGIVTTSQGVALLSINSILPRGEIGSPVGYLMVDLLMIIILKKSLQELALPLKAYLLLLVRLWEDTEVEIIDEDKIKGNVYLDTIDKKHTYSFSFNVKRKSFSKGKKVSFPFLFINYSECSYFRF